MVVAAGLNRLEITSAGTVESKPCLPAHIPDGGMNTR